MLVLSRKEQEQIFIGPDIVITVVRIKSHTVNIGVDAPRELKISRTKPETIQNQDAE